jgi:DNA polymerase-3 subunit delta'
VIEEPGARTVWLLCAPTLTDVLPTIRSRCRHLALRTPSIKAVTQLLIERGGIDPKMAEFAANAAGGHIGRAKYYATNSKARDTREEILKLSKSISNLSSALKAASDLMELAKSNAKNEMESKNLEELSQIRSITGLTDNKRITGANRTVKEIEKKQDVVLKRYANDLLQNECQELMMYKMNDFIQSMESSKLANIKEFYYKSLISDNKEIFDSKVINILQLERFLISNFL